MRPALTSGYVTHHARRTANGPRVGVAMIEQLESRRLLTDAVRLSDIMPGAADSLALSSGEYVAAGGKFYFSAVDSHGQQPYGSDGTPAGTKALLSGGLNGGTSADPSDFTAGGGFVYFTAVTGTNQRRQVFRSDGTTAGTIQVSNLPDPGFASNLHFVNGHLLFFDLNNFALWRVDDKVSKRVGDASPDTFYGVLGNKFYFDNSDSIHGKQGFNATDGSTISLVSTVNNSGIGPEPFGAVLGNELIFQGVDDSGVQLWKTNGTLNGTARLATIKPGVGTGDGSYPYDWALSGTSLYFLADGGPTAGGVQIYRTDGTNVNKITNLSNNGLEISGLTDVNGTLFFVYAGGAKTNLYKIVNDQPVRVGGASGGTDGGTSPAYLTAVGSTLYFNALDSSKKAHLFQSDGTTITLAPGDSGSNPTALTNVNGSLFFEATDAKFGSELHVISSGVQPPLPPLSINLGPSKIINEGDTVTFHGTLSHAPGEEAKKFWWDYEGTGKFVLQPVKGPFTHTYTDVPTRGSVRARVKVLTNLKRIVYDSINVLINNVAPTLTLTESSLDTAPYLPITYTAQIKDPGVNDSFTATWNFGDGTPDIVQSVGSARTVSLSHVFKKANSYPVSVSVMDKNKGSDETETSAEVKLVSSAEAKGGVDMLIGHVHGGHKVHVEVDNVVPGFIDVYIDGKFAAHFYKKTLKGIIIAEGPDDKVVIDPALKHIPTTLVKVKR